MKLNQVLPFENELEAPCVLWKFIHSGNMLWGAVVPLFVLTQVPLNFHKSPFSVSLGQMLFRSSLVSVLGNDTSPLTQYFRNPSGKE